MISHLHLLLTAGKNSYTKSLKLQVCAVFISVPPSSPRNIRFFNISSSYMNITWVAPLNTGNCEVVMYRLEYKVLEPGQEWKIKRIYDKRTFYILKGQLRAGRIYIVSLSAVNCAGVGPKSKQYRITFAAKGKSTF